MGKMSQPEYRIFQVKGKTGLSASVHSAKIFLGSLGPCRIRKANNGDPDQIVQIVLGFSLLRRIKLQLKHNKITHYFVVYLCSD